MAKTKQGDLMSCMACGLIVTVDEVCGCEETVLVCCDQTMQKGKTAAERARKKNAAKTGGVKAAKAAAKVSAPKAAAKKAAKPAAKPGAKK